MSGRRDSLVVAGRVEQLLEAELNRIIRARRLIESIAPRLNEVTGDDVARRLDNARELLNAAAWGLDLVPERAGL